MAGKNARDTPNWKKIKAEYIRGGISQQKLADKHGVPYDTLHKRAGKEKWSALRSEASIKAAQKLPEKIADSQSDMAARLTAKLDQGALAACDKLISALKDFPDNAGTRTVREAVKVREFEVNGTTRQVPLKSSFISDLESIVRSLSLIAKQYGLDAAGRIAAERLELERNTEGAAAAFDSMQDIVELINHPMPDRTIAEVDGGGNDG